MFTEQMNEHFVKYHTDGLPFPAVFHKFTAPDLGYPHDHPWGFQTHILKGGYVEEVFQINEDGFYGSAEFTRLPGMTHFVRATQIHRIVALLEPECWTLILPEQGERTSRFWRFEDTIFSKA